MEQFNLDMLKDEHMRQQYAVEVNNIFDCLEHEVTEQEYEKDRVDILWTNIKEGIQKAAHNILPNIVKKNKKPWISTDILDDNMCFEKEALVNVWIEYMGELYADDRVTRRLDQTLTMKVVPRLH